MFGEVIPEVYSGKLFRLQITGFGTSLRLFFRPSRLSREGRKNEPFENPKSAIFAAKAPPPNKHLKTALFIFNKLVRATHDGPTSAGSYKKVIEFAVYSRQNFSFEGNELFCSFLSNGSMGWMFFMEGIMFVQLNGHSVEILYGIRHIGPD